MTKSIKIGIIVVLAGVFCFSAVHLIQQLAMYSDVKDNDRDAEESFLIPGTDPWGEDDPGPNPGPIEYTKDPDDTVDPGLVNPGDSDGSIWPQFQLNWTEIKKTNKDIMGWIWMYDTTVSYPLLQTTDNVKYVTTQYNNKPGKLGSLFVDYRNSGALDDRNTVIYGHNGGAGIKLGVLTKFLNRSYLDKHKYICIITEKGLLKYEIFSVYKVDAKDRTYSVKFYSEDTFANHITHVSGLSAIKTGVSATAKDRILTLSTCTNNRAHPDERLVLIAKLVD